MSHIAADSFAAVDLGSNSFHMIVANYSDGRLQVVDRLKDMVRLASGLDTKRNLTQESMDRAIQCLERFRQRIQEIPKVNVRAVGTNTLRQARNRRAFLTQARNALGHPIEVIAGREEARLIFLGVAHSVYNETNQRLVVDIGGGSTELIIGRGFEPRCMESLYMGCVSTSEQFFGNGDITAKAMRRALLFARQELESVKANYRKVGWDSAIGASGTILAIHDLVRSRGWSDAGITPQSLEALRDNLISLGNLEAAELEGVSERRRPVFTGGVAILSAVFEALGIEHMTVSDGALREGLLYDLIGRIQDKDVRDDTITDLAQRYSVDPDQAKRVQDTALDLLKQARKTWQFNARDDRKLLGWAARAHEVGLSIAHAQYHHHGGYLLTHSDLPGFSREEQLTLAVLVRLHRRKFTIEELDQLAEPERLRVSRLCVLLRLAVLLNRSRTLAALPPNEITATDRRVDLRFPEGWLGEHPLTQTDLETERDLLRDGEFELNFN
ncbi:MAG: exopolyphosphatase [Gammaproteobacteria bacterium]